MPTACTVGSTTQQTCGATHEIIANVGVNKLIVGGKMIIVEGILWGMHARPKSSPHPEKSLVSSSRLKVGGKSVTLDKAKLSNGATAQAMPACKLTVSK